MRPQRPSRSPRVTRIAGAALLCVTAGLSLVACAAQPSPRAMASATPDPAPSPAPSPTPTPDELRHERAVEIVDARSTRDNVAGIVMGTMGGTDADALRAFVDELGLGGFLLMGDNVPASPEALAELTARLTVDPELPLLTAIDQEGGVVSRLPWDRLPAADTLKFEKPARTEQAFEQRAALIAEGGANTNFGIVADVAASPDEFIFSRALGTAPDDAAERVARAVQGERGTVLSTLKHFPGHGAAPGDSHFIIPTTGKTFEEWRSQDGAPFAAGIEAGAELLMFGHLVYEAVDPLPATLSAEWHRIAREDLGFDGLAVTDDLGMLLSSGLPDYQDPARNAAQALGAGNDLLVVVVGSDPATLTATIDGVAAAVERGEVPDERLTEAAVRVTELRLELAERSEEP